MALVEGTNCGFVTVAPTSDPEGNQSTIDNFSDVSKYTSPSDAVKIIKIGWYCSSDATDINFEVGLYSDNAGVPDVLLQVERTNALGTGVGWRTVTVDWAISASTPYWLGVQVDDTSPAIAIDMAPSGFNGSDFISGSSTLPGPFNGGEVADADASDAIYALIETGTPASATDNMNIIGENIY